MIRDLNSLELHDYYCYYIQIDYLKFNLLFTDLIFTSVTQILECQHFKYLQGFRFSTLNLMKTLSCLEYQYF